MTTANRSGKVFAPGGGHPVFRPTAVGEPDVPVSQTSSGPTTGNKEVATADLRFRRTDRLRVEVPAAPGDVVTARLLDRRGTALAVPVAAAARDDPGGMRWQTAEVALAPFAPGDYVIELASGSARTLVAFRIVP